MRAVKELIDTLSQYKADASALQGCAGQELLSRIRSTTSYSISGKLSDRGFPSQPVNETCLIGFDNMKQIGV